MAVAAENLVGPEGKGLRVAFTGLNTERILTSSLCTGIGRYALNKAVDYANSRRVWDQPIGAHQASPTHLRPLTFILRPPGS